ncbi:MAG TPA: hypothetical protein VN577_10465 [Terriglobales bacterium]|nr:hypothetical protein [Terriglobales bacterium]
MAILVGINVFAAGALAYMLVRTSALPGDFQQLRQQVQNRKGKVVPPEIVNERVKQAREEIGKFYEQRFPNSSAAVFETLGKIAKENRVKLNQATYRVDETDMPGLRQVVISANLDGDYVQTVKFINALERDKNFFVIGRVALGDQKSGQVRLTLQIETFMRGQA